MKFSPKTHRTWLGILAIVVCIAQLPACGGSQSSSSIQPLPVRATSYYLDCSSNASGSGTQASPWNSLANANAFAFQAGDSLLLKRGTTCIGSLTPQGSGRNGAPIIVDAYGTGSPPILDGGMNEEVIKLVDQQYWELKNLEIVGGDSFGIYVVLDQQNSVLNHVYLRNLDVHGAHHKAANHGDSAEIHVECPININSHCNDILMDGVMVHDSTISDGIFVGGYPYSATTPFNTNVTVQNSTVHDIGGIGILLMEMQGGMIQNNVVYNTGLCVGCNFSSDAIAYVFCRSCVMQNNESYANQTPITAYDGGDFDLEDSVDSVVQYNYGHDSSGYCLAHFPGPYTQTANNTFRYNICSNNGQTSSLAYQGELVLNSGSTTFDGVQVYNNTFYWNPAGTGPVVSAQYVRYSGANPNFFKNNIIYSAAPNMVYATSGLAADNNIYWTTSGNSPSWQIDGNTYTGFGSYQASTGQDTHSSSLDPVMLNPTYHMTGKPATAFTLQPGSPAIGTGADVCFGIEGCSMGQQDFWGNPLPNRSGYSIGAYQPQ